MSKAGIGNLEKIFTGLRKRGGILVGVYNDETAAENFSVRFIDLFDAADSFSVNEGVAQDFFELNDESDFVCLVRKIIFDAPLEMYLSLRNYFGDKSKLKAHLKILCKNFSAQTKIYLVPREEVYTPFQSQPENLAFLKKIWGYDSAGKSLIFQFPALWLAEKFQLFTIVISPLIRQQIVQKISVGEVNILYISPETLLARSDVEQLIGARTLGLIVAHIVTTWGKQFRPTSVTTFGACKKISVSAGGTPSLSQLSPPR